MMRRRFLPLRRLVPVGVLASLALASLALTAGCAARDRDHHERGQVVRQEARAPETLLPTDLAMRSDTALLHNARRMFDTSGHPECERQIRGIRN